MFAKQIPSILPQLTMREAIETTKVHSICGLLNGQYRFVTNRPFRSPHHTISGAGSPLDKSQPLLEQIKAGIQAVRVGAHCPSGFTASSICAEISFGSGTAPVNWKGNQRL